MSALFREVEGERKVVAHPSALKLKKVEVEAAAEAVVIAPPVAAAPPALAKITTHETFRTVFAMILGLVVFVGLWAFVAKFGRIPDPLAVFREALVLFSDPFYRKGP